MSSKDEVDHDQAIRMAEGTVLRLVRKYDGLVIDEGRKTPECFVRVHMRRAHELAPSIDGQEAIIGQTLRLLTEREVLEVKPHGDRAYAYVLGPKAPPPSDGLERRLNRRARGGRPVLATS